jgi:Trypsin
MGRKSNVWVGGLVLAVGALAACAEAEWGGAQGVASLASDLIGGEAGVPFNTGTVYFYSRGNQCTGVMIGANQVLTAAHCVVDASRMPDAGPSPNDPTTANVSAAFAPDAGIELTNGTVTSFSTLNWFHTTILGTENMVVSVTYPDNYDWLVNLGGSSVSAVATFGAGK